MSERKFTPIGDAFNPLGDAAHLLDRKPEQPEETTAPSAPAPTTTPSKPTPSGSPTRPTVPAPTNTPERADATVQIRMPRSLAEQFRETATRIGRRHPALVLDAVEATYERLPELLTAGTTRPTTTTTNLFNRSTVASKPIAEPKDTILIRVTKSHRDTLDELTRTLGAPNRNTLLVTAVTAYLETLRSVDDKGAS